MSALNDREKELVAIGAAIGSNCIPCVEYHFPKAAEAGLSPDEIKAALDLADTIKRVPAKKVIQVARELVEGNACASRQDGGGSCC